MKLKRKHNERGPCFWCKQGNCPSMDVLRDRMADITRIEAFLDVERADGPTIPVVISTETPLPGMGPDFEPVDQILQHTDEAVDLSRAPLPIIESHDMSSLNIGLVENVRLDGRQLRGDIRMGSTSRAQEVLRDIKARIVRSVSVGARIIDHTMNKAGQMVVTRWQPVEMSLVAAGLDPAAQTYRADTGTPKDGGAADPGNGQHPAPITKRNTTMSEELNPEVAAATIDQAIARGAKEAREYTAEMLAIGEKYECMELAREAITNGMDLKAFAMRAVDHWYELGQKRLEEAATQNPATHLDLTPQETRRFSVTRALNAFLERDWSNAGFELECHKAIQAAIPDYDAKGVLIPADVQARGFSQEGWQLLANQRPEFLTQVSREMQTGTPGAGEELVGTQHLSGSFIDLLRVTTQVLRLGATALPGLRQNLSIPKKTAGATFQWLAEGGAVTLTDLGTGAVTLSPTTLAGGTKSSRRLMKQSLPAVDDLIMADLTEGAAETLDLGAIQGSGAANQPLGIVNQTGVLLATVAVAGTPTYDETVGFRTASASANALRGNMAWLTTSAIVGHWMTERIDAGSGRLVMDPSLNTTSAIGYPVGEQNAITANTIIFGYFPDVLIGMWGVLDLRPDPYTAADEDALIIRAFQDIDVAIRHGESFVINDTP